MSKSENRPTRRAASYMLRHMVDFLSFAVYNYKLSIEEVAMVCLIGAESTRPIVDDPFLANKYGSELDVLPLEDRPAIALKFIYVTLGINRETARRKMDRLVARGFVVKTPDGYVLPEQTGETDFTRELRNFMLHRYEAIIAEGERYRRGDQS